MSKYYEALKRTSAALEDGSIEACDAVMAKPLESPPTAAPAVALPIVRDVPWALAKCQPIRRLAESLAPTAARGSMRLLISGCRPGDGASTIATALSIDLSQRLALRTLLLDAHLAHPVLDRLLPLAGPVQLSAVRNGPIRVRPTGWPRLDLGVCAAVDEPSKEFFEALEDSLIEYPAVVVDLGVVRLDARMLPVARPQDPLMLVVRYGHTERQELATSAIALAAVDRTPAGVILDGVSLPPPGRLRRLMHI